MTQRRTFSRKKMRWLNAISKDSAVSATAFRVAYLIGDHLNVGSEDAWPSHRRLASMLSLTTKTIQRTSGQLERRGWLTIKRSPQEKTSNRYRLRWPPGMEEPDNSVPQGRQAEEGEAVPDVRQSFLQNPSRTYLSGRRGRETYFPDRAQYEQLLALRFQPDGEELIYQLHKAAPELLHRLCIGERDATITDADVDGAKLYLKSLSPPSATGSFRSVLSCGPHEPGISPAKSGET